MPWQTATANHRPVPRVVSATLALSAYLAFQWLGAGLAVALARVAADPVAAASTLAWAGVARIGLAGLAALVVVFPMRAWPGGSVREALGLATPSLAAAFAGAVAGLALAGVVVGLGWVVLAPAPAPLRADILWRLHLPWLLALVLLAPLVEETLFRGALLGAYGARIGPVAGGLLATALFVAAHALLEGVAHGPAVLAWTALGLCCLGARLGSGSVVPAVLLHAFYNAGLLALAYL